jgi:hypothetical protein
MVTSRNSHALVSAGAFRCVWWHGGADVLAMRIEDRGLKLTAWQVVRGKRLLFVLEKCYLQCHTNALVFLGARVAFTCWSSTLRLAEKCTGGCLELKNDELRYSSNLSPKASTRAKGHFSGHLLRIKLHLKALVVEAASKALEHEGSRNVIRGHLHPPERNESVSPIISHITLARIISHIASAPPMAPKSPRRSLTDSEKLNFLRNPSHHSEKNLTEYNPGRHVDQSEVNDAARPEYSLCIMSNLRTDVKESESAARTV